MDYSYEECFREGEEVFRGIYKEVNNGKYLTPINFNLENDKFKEAYLSGKMYNPQYKYLDRSNINFGEMYRKLDTISFPSDGIGEMYSAEKRKVYCRLKFFENLSNSEAMTKLGKKIYGVPNTNYVKKAKDILSLESKSEEKVHTAKELLEKVKECLDDYSLNWNLILSYDIPSKVRVNPGTKTIYINGNQKFSVKDIGRLCVHEISTHVLRAENGALRQYSILKDGTANAISTEEGLALYNEDISGNINTSMLKLYAARFLSVINMDNKSFCEMVKDIEPSIGLDNAIYVVARIKIGLEDTSKNGGFVLDYVYFQGYIDVKNEIKKDPSLYVKLYYGCIGIEDIDLFKNDIDKAIEDNKIILPHWVVKRNL